MAIRAVPVDAKRVRPPQADYSHVIEVEAGTKLYFLAGQVGVRPDGSVPVRFADQVEAVFNNITGVLESCGLTLDNIVKIKHLVVGAENVSAYRAARKKFMGDRKPASTLVVVAGLARPEIKLEVEVIAAGP